MELEFTADQDELRDSIRAVLAKESPVGLARRVVDDGERPDALWATLSGLGWPALTISEADGGIGLGMIEAAILAEEIGRVIAPGPAARDRHPVRARGPRDRPPPSSAPASSARSLRASAPARSHVAERNGSFDPAAVTATFVVDGSHVVLAGEKRFVVEGDAVDELVDRRPGTRTPSVTTVFARSSCPWPRPARAGARARRQPPLRARRSRRRAGRTGPRPRRRTARTPAPCAAPSKRRPSPPRSRSSAPRRRSST